MLFFSFATTHCWDKNLIKHEKLSRFYLSEDNVRFFFFFEALMNPSLWNNVVIFQPTIVSEKQRKIACLMEKVSFAHRMHRYKEVDRIKYFARINWMNVNEVLNYTFTRHFIYSASELITLD